MTYTSPTTAMAHQTAALRKRASRPQGFDDGFCDQAEMGCGKTFVILKEWQAMVDRGYCVNLLVTAPAGCLKNWHADKSEDQPSELRRHLDPKLFKKLAVVVWAKGTAAKRKMYLDMGAPPPRAMFVNIEAISANEEAVNACKQFLKSGPTMMVVDESTTIRAKKSNRTKIITKELRPLAKARRIMTGLIAPKSPLDVFWQFYFLDPKILGYDDDFVLFRQRYANTKAICMEPMKLVRERLRHVMGLNRVCTPGYLRDRLSLVYNGQRVIPKTMDLKQVTEELEVAAEGMNRDQAVSCILRMGGWIKHHVEVDGFKNLGELQLKLEPFTFRVLKKDCMDLPPKVYMPPREVEMTSQQLRMYDDMKAKCIAELEGQHVVATTVIAQMIRLHQIALGHCADENGVPFDIPSNRIKDMLAVLKDREGKVIIWSNYRREIAKIVKALQEEYGDEAVAQFHGGNQKTRDEEERRFLTRPECEFMCSTQAAGGRGNTWNAAGMAIYCSNSHDLELRLQSEDRNHRKGQEADKVTYLDFYCSGTVEEKILYALRNKINLATAITGENYREWLI